MAETENWLRTLYNWADTNHIPEKRIPRDTKKLLTMTTLDLSGLRLETLPCDLHKLTALKTLILIYNHITIFPACLLALQNLESLFLSHNQITELPENIGVMKNLKGLGLQHNNLTNLPASITNLTALTYFNLYHNDLTHLPEDLNSLQKLEYFDVENNPNLFLSRKIKIFLDTLEEARYQDIAYENQDIDNLIFSLEDAICYKDKDAYEKLMRYHKHENDELRIAVAVNLDAFSKEKAMPYLLDYLENDSCEEVRYEALESITNFRCDESYALLIQQAQKTHKKRRFHQIIARKLKSYPTQHSVDILMRFLRESKDRIVWSNAVDSLTKMQSHVCSSFWKELLLHQCFYVQKSAFLQLFKQFEQEKQNRIIVELYPSNFTKDAIAAYPKRKVKHLFELLLNQSTWVVLRAWETKENLKEQLQNCHLSDFYDSSEIANEKGKLVDYKLFNPTIVLYTLVYEKQTLDRVANGIIHNEIGLEPFFNAGAYFINFGERPLLLNLPDDRAIELIFRKKDDSFFRERIKQLI